MYGMSSCTLKNTCQSFACGRRCHFVSRSQLTYSILILPLFLKNRKCLFELDELLSGGHLEVGAKFFSQNYDFELWRKVAPSPDDDAVYNLDDGAPPQEICQLSLTVDTQAAGLSSSGGKRELFHEGPGVKTKVPKITNTAKKQRVEGALGTLDVTYTLLENGLTITNVKAEVQDAYVNQDFDMQYRNIKGGTSKRNGEFDGTLEDTETHIILYDEEGNQLVTKLPEYF